MTFEELIAAKVREAVHQALDERAEHALPELYTLQQAEDYYRGGIKVKTLRALCRSRVIPHVRFNDEGRIYLTPEGLRAAIEQCSVPPTTRPRIPRPPKQEAL